MILRRYEQIDPPQREYRLKKIIQVYLGEPVSSSGLHLEAMVTLSSHITEKVDPSTRL